MFHSWAHLSEILEVNRVLLRLGFECGHRDKIHVAKSKFVIKSWENDRRVARSQQEAKRDASPTSLRAGFADTSKRRYAGIAAFPY
jgi:hypothetical protein